MPGSSRDGSNWWFGNYDLHGVLLKNGPIRERVANTFSYIAKVLGDALAIGPSSRSQGQFGSIAEPSLQPGLQLTGWVQGVDY